MIDIHTHVVPVGPPHRGYKLCGLALIIFLYHNNNGNPQLLSKPLFNEQLPCAHECGITPEIFCNLTDPCSQSQAVDSPLSFSWLDPRTHRIVNGEKAPTDTPVNLFHFRLSPASFNNHLLWACDSSIVRLFECRMRTDQTTYCACSMRRGLVNCHPIAVGLSKHKGAQVRMRCLGWTEKIQQNQWLWDTYLFAAFIGRVLAWYFTIASQWVKWHQHQRHLTLASRDM